MTYNIAADIIYHMVNDDCTFTFDNEEYHIYIDRPITNKETLRIVIENREEFNLFKNHKCVILFWDMGFDSNEIDLLNNMSRKYKIEQFLL